MDLYLPYILLVCFAAGIGWLILLAMIYGKWPIGKEEKEENLTTGDLNGEQ